MASKGLSPPPSSPASSKSTVLPTLNRCLLLTKSLPRRGDLLLTRLTLLLSQPSGIDALLSTTSYALILVNALLLRPLILRRKSAGRGGYVAGRLLAVENGGKALSSLIGDFRVFSRLWGLLAIWAWAKSARAARSVAVATAIPASTTLAAVDTHYRDQDEKADRGGAERGAVAPTEAEDARRPEGPKVNGDTLLHALETTQIAACAAFQVLENGAYLGQKGILTSSGWTGERGQRRIAWWYMLSSRFWALHVGLDIVRLVMVYRSTMGTRAREEATQGAAETEKDEEEEEAGAKWRRDMMVSLAYAPLTMHWGVEGGIVSEATVGVLGTVASGIGLIEAWKGLE